jgi:hypothetical protein
VLEPPARAKTKKGVTFLIPTEVSIPEERDALICAVDLKRSSLAHPCLCNVAGTRAPSVPTAMARVLGPVDVALGVKFRPGVQAEAAWDSSTSLLRRASRSLHHFQSTVWIATLTSSRLSQSCSKGRAASVDGDHSCRDCDGTGWVLYRSERKDGEFEEAYRLCPKGHAPRYCMGSSSGHLCPCPATRRCGSDYLCRQVAFPQPIIHENVQRDQERIQLHVVLPLKFAITPM